MDFDEWWDSTQPKPAEDMRGFLAPLKAHAKMGWNAALKNQWRPLSTMPPVP